MERVRRFESGNEHSSGVDRLYVAVGHINREDACHSSLGKAARVDQAFEEASCSKHGPCPDDETRLWGAPPASRDPSRAAFARRVRDPRTRSPRCSLRS